MKTIVIMGGGIAGPTAGAYLKKKFPQLRVVIIAPPERKEPLVGESLTEYSTYFMRELGLDSHLEERQFSKYGLTFHFKRDIDDPADRTYVVDEAAARPPLPAFLINRATFDSKLKELCHARGVEWLSGKVKHVTPRPDGFELRWESEPGARNHIQADWVIDATGRRRLLARQWNLGTEPPSQRSCFWFRLRGFDRNYLDKAVPLKQKQHHFDSYFSAQHFFGRGKWVWCIPLSTGREEEEGYSLSVGLTWRTDLFDKTINTTQAFVEEIEKEHPLLAELVRSGTVVDTNFYSNYMYNSQQLYDRSGWFILGDAGWTVDPLYSIGFSLMAVQIEQIAGMIARGDALDDTTVRTFEACFKQMHETTSYNVEQLYPRMHDPYQAYWTINQFVAVYFYFVLPMLLSGYHTHPVGARLLTFLARAGKDATDSLHTLLAPGSMRCPEVSPRTLPRQHHRIVNWELWGPDETKVPQFLSRFLRLNAQMRLELLRNAGWPNPIHHVAMAGSDLLKSAAVGLAFRRRSFLDSKVLARLVPTPQLEHAHVSETEPQATLLEMRSRRLDPEAPRHVSSG